MNENLSIDTSFIMSLFNVTLKISLVFFKRVLIRLFLKFFLLKKLKVFVTFKKKKIYIYIYIYNLANCLI